MIEREHTLGFSFPKSEKLCGKRDIAFLMEHGRRGGAGCLRYCCLVTPLISTEKDEVRLLISVPKKHFKRAVKRNLLKRRIREAFRLQKSLLLAPAEDSTPVMAGDTLPVAPSSVAGGSMPVKTGDTLPMAEGTLSVADGGSMPVMAGLDRPSRRYDLLLTYIAPDIADYDTIRTAVATILTDLRSWRP